MRHIDKEIDKLGLQDIEPIIDTSIFFIAIMAFIVGALVMWVIIHYSRD